MRNQQLAKLEMFQFIFSDLELSKSYFRVHMECTSDPGEE